jgi:3-hydroxy acid dehydrogenase / malonic semialdehyde reductase
MTKTILITGASSGFGEATAKLLAKDGHRLILIARRIERLEQLKLSLGGTILCGQVDVTNKQQINQFLSSLTPKFQNIDVLINNAGLALGITPAQESSLEDWEQMVDTNIKGLLYITHPVLKSMNERGSGHLINIGSVAAHVPYKGGNVYGATKAFVRQFSRNLRADLIGSNVKVTNIEPGMAETEFSVVRFKGEEAKAKTVYENTRSLTAEDIAHTIQWAIDQPERVNIDTIEIMPVDQTYGGLAIHRSH